ncbi:MAG: endonuclease/exonuclease/phosphatase family protein [Micrococcales bacterium]|nr:endonuclease/exonuclease/phosphatase family protein [Micrococcales bacterium]
MRVNARWLDAAIGAVLVVLVLVGAARWIDTTARPIVIAQTGGPFVVVGLGLLFAVTVLLRRWWMLAPVAVVLSVALTQAVPTFLASTHPEAQRVMTVMSSNLDYGQANAEQLMAAVRARAADVLVLIEATPDAVRRLEDAGLDDVMPHHVGAARAENATVTLVYSRYPMSAVVADTAAETTPGTAPEVTLDVLGAPVRLKAVHVMPPLAGDTVRWRAGLSDLAQWRGRQPATERLVLVGDFNAGFGHPGFRDVVGELTDAQRANGGGWVRTWPFVGHRMPPFVALDHVLSRGLVPMDAGQEAIHGTDHAIVWGAYALTAEPAKTR